MHTREKLQLCLLDMEKLRGPEKTWGAVETVEKLQLNYSCEAEEKSLYKKQTKYTK